MLVKKHVFYMFELQTYAHVKAWTTILSAFAYCVHLPRACESGKIIRVKYYKYLNVF